MVVTSYCTVRHSIKELFARDSALLNVHLANLCTLCDEDFDEMVSCFDKVANTTDFSQYLDCINNAF